MEAMCYTPRERKSKSLDKGSDSVGREVKMRKRKREKRKEGKGKKWQKRKNGEHTFLVLFLVYRKRERGEDE